MTRRFCPQEHIDITDPNKLETPLWHYICQTCGMRWASTELHYGAESYWGLCPQDYPGGTDEIWMYAPRGLPAVTVRDLLAQEGFNALPDGYF